MLEKVGNKDIIVRNYSSNFDVKEFIQGVLIPAAFPNIPVGKLNLGLTGIASEMIGQAVEDAQGTASLMMNEAFISKAILPDSIYSSAALFNLGYQFATPSRCSFALQLWIEDIEKYSTRVSGTNIERYKLDKDTTLLLGDNGYRLDYDIIIDSQFIDGRRVYNVYYDIDETNSISRVTNQNIKYHVTSIKWLVLFVDLMEFDRKVETTTISDNLVTVNSDIQRRWTNQIAGIDVVYITPQGERIPMTLKTEYTQPDVDPFCWYKFDNDQALTLSFSSNKGYFVPSFNSKIETTIYTCRGKGANFDSYDRKAGVPVQKNGEHYDYNANTRMVALCYGGSTGGLDRGNLELLRSDIIKAYNTANVLTTDHDLMLWFQNYAQRYNTKAQFFKRRDDPSGRLFSQFIAIVDDSNYVYPTNTLSIRVTQDQFDFVNSDAAGQNQEFIIKPGHLWEYDDTEEETTRDRLRMIPGTDGMAMVTDDALPHVGTTRPYMFVNPFYIKIHKNPMISASYNYLIDHTSWPESIPIQTDMFYQFQLATMSVERNLTKGLNKCYRIQVICVPVVSDQSIKYVEGIGEEFPVENNNLRLVLITRTANDGETGYIEMTPVEERTNGSSWLFQADIAVDDNLDSEMCIEVDLANTPGMKSLITTGIRKGKVYMDSAETSFHIACIMKDFESKSTATLFDDPNFVGYVMANRFANANRDLTLYKPMTMMRNTIEFSGENDNYTVDMSLVPFLRYDIPLDAEKMAYFTRAFGEQYQAMEPVLNKLDGNSFLDFKLYNTYGRSNNYYIGPQEGKDVLWDSDILLDNVYVRIKMKISVYDRTMYSQTVDAVVNQIKTFFESLQDGEIKDVHVSNITHMIEQNQPNVRYVRFLGFNDYDATKQSIFTKYDDISELREDQLKPYVPEMIRVDSESIDITEEI